MVVVQLAPDDPRLPRRVRACCVRDGPSTISALGNLGILSQTKLGLLCSQKVPGSIIIGTYDAVRMLRDRGVVFAGGFHSPMEKECLSILLRGDQPIIICPARSIENGRIAAELKKPLDDGRLLVLSPFEGRARRTTATTAIRRNEFVAALVDSLFVPFATQNGKIDALVRIQVAEGRSIYTIDAAQNEVLATVGKSIGIFPAREPCES